MRPFLPLIALAATGCQAFDPGACTAEVLPAIVVTIRDSVTGAPVAAGAIGQVEDHRYVDSLQAYGFEGTPSVMVSRAAAYERPGTYEVTVFHDDYDPWIRGDVEVADNGCHVETVQLVARMVPR